VKRIKVAAPDSDLAKALDKATTTPVLLEKDGEFYSLKHVDANQEDLFVNYETDVAIAMSLVKPITPEELTRRKALSEKILAKREERVITPLTTAELVRQARKKEMHD